MGDAVLGHKFTKSIESALLDYTLGSHFSMWEFTAAINRDGKIEATSDFIRDFGEEGVGVLDS